LADRFEKERRFAALKAEKDGLKEREKEINKELRELEEQILEDWAAESVTGVPLTDVSLSLRRAGFIKLNIAGDRATPEEKAAICQALKDAGYGEYVSEGYNSRSVSTLAKDEHWDRELPPELEGKLTFEPKYEIQVRKKSKKKDDAGEQLPTPN
jgi:hypothetical protein